MCCLCAPPCSAAPSSNGKTPDSDSVYRGSNPRGASSAAQLGSLTAPRSSRYGCVMTSSPLDRAYELARSGQYKSVSEIIRHLPAPDRSALEVALVEPGARRELILVCSAAWLARE